MHKYVLGGAKRGNTGALLIRWWCKAFTESTVAVARGHSTGPRPEPKVRLQTALCNRALIRIVRRVMGLAAVHTAVTTQQKCA